MAGLIQIMIWMFCGYLVFKVVEIFRIALVIARDGMSRGTGIQKRHAKSKK